MDISDSSVQGRSFFKIMFSEICLHDKMMIPGKFVRKYGKCLNGRVFNSKNPSFILTVFPSYLGPGSQVDIKRDFAKRYLRRRVCLQVEERTWHVRCIVYQNRYRDLVKVGYNLQEATHFL
ncbi:hypothetical protein POM88_013062 [Heracleum sosnowskyi]|uniref:Uncharacterized protein n=1 Tax=Heracleum sosnowskyi TaxID=360622 RepID=A0AAD8N2X9_9APIA|nr:hypothetical protein POM88_013062 [Heracleum sosnowskyi]